MKSLTFLIFLFAFKVSSAQEVSVLPKDETGKYIHYEVVTTKITADSLQARLLDFLSKHKKEIKLKSVHTKSTLANGKLIIQKTTTMLSHPSGEITYQFNLEKAEGKYRFWLTDFEFFPYYKDRYGNFVPSTTVGVPLENEPKKSNAEQWEDYRLQTSKYAANFAKRLKDHLEDKAKLPTSTPEKKVVSKNWE